MVSMVGFRVGRFKMIHGDDSQPKISIAINREEIKDGSEEEHSEWGGNEDQRRLASVDAPDLVRPFTHLSLV